LLADVASEREAFRVCLDKLPLNDEPICDACLLAFWRNLGLPVSDDKEGKALIARVGQGALLPAT
jgi:hypothetical protein